MHIESLQHSYQYIKFYEHRVMQSTSPYLVMMAVQGLVAGLE